MTGRMWKHFIAVFAGVIFNFSVVFSQSYAEFRNYGPSRGIMPITYANLINNSISSLSQAKKYAEEAISLYLDDGHPLPKNFYGDFKDENGNDATPFYHSNTGCDDLMWALFQVYKNYPEDAGAQNYRDLAVKFADHMLEYGTDRYGNEHTPLLASILTRDSIPMVPEDPELPGESVKVEKRSVYSYDIGKFRNNYVALSLGNYWYGSDESHKISWQGADLADDEKLYQLLYDLSAELGDEKYKNAANASISFFISYCPSETGLLPWGEHSGWDFYADQYTSGYYHVRLHELRGGKTLYDRFTGLQPRVQRGELTKMEKYVLAYPQTHYRFVSEGANLGRMTYCRHGVLWTDRETAVKSGEMHEDFGTFPKHAGNWLSQWGHVYNRSFNKTFMDSIETQTEVFTDGMEGIREAYGSDYYPYGGMYWDGRFKSQMSNNQNDKLSNGSAEAAWFFRNRDVLAGKLRTMAQRAGGKVEVNMGSYPGPDIVSIIKPLDKSNAATDSITFEWLPSERAFEYHIYISENLNDLRTATVDSASFLSCQPDLYLHLDTLEKDKTYYWAVDAVGESFVRRGEIVSFSTHTMPLPADKISIDQEDMDIKIGEQFYLTATVLPSGSSDRSVRWSSSDTSIVMITEDGLLAARDTGIAMITAGSHDPGLTDQVSIKVSQRYIPVLSLKLKEYLLTPETGDTFTLDVVIYPPDANDQAVHWYSDNPDVATVDQNGFVQVLDAGYAKVFAELVNGSLFAYCTIVASWPLNSKGASAETFRMYPNPADDKVRINGMMAGDRLLIMDINGKVLMESREILTELSVKSLAEGLYLARLIRRNETFNFKLIKSPK